VLNYEFTDWLGDDLLEAFPCFIVTARLAQALRESSLTGWALKPVMISQSEECRYLCTGEELPDFEWLEVVGAPTDDWSLTSDCRLVVSDTALDLLKKLNIRKCRSIKDCGWAAVVRDGVL
jgi:hypothetical protein